MPTDTFCHMLTRASGSGVHPPTAISPRAQRGDRAQSPLRVRAPSRTHQSPELPKIYLPFVRYLSWPYSRRRSATRRIAGAGGTRDVVAAFALVCTGSGGVCAPVCAFLRTPSREPERRRKCLNHLVFASTGRSLSRERLVNCSSPRPHTRAAPRRERLPLRTRTIGAGEMSDAPAALAPICTGSGGVCAPVLRSSAHPEPETRAATEVIDSS